MGGAAMGGQPMGGVAMGGQPMGGASMGGQPLGSARMGGQPMGGYQPIQPIPFHPQTQFAYNNHLGYGNAAPNQYGYGMVGAQKQEDASFMGGEDAPEDDHSGIA